MWAVWKYHCRDLIIPSCRAYLYARVDVEGGWIVWVNERLLHVVCKKAEDKELDPTFIELDPCTLKAGHLVSEV